MIRRAGTALASLLLVVGQPLPRISPSPGGQPLPRTSAPAAAAPSVVDVWGDSTAVLCGNTPPAGFCAPLGQLLAQAGAPVTFINRAVGGTDCGYTATNAAAWLAVDRPQLVILLCGTNQDTSTPAAIATAGTEWRTITDAVHATGAVMLASFIQYSNATIQAVAGRTWLEPSEERFNDQVVYPNLSTYLGLLVDLQQVPSSSDYTLRVNSTGGWDGIHPTDLGYQVYAALMYRAIRAYYGWPDTVPQPCGMTGLEARGPTYEQYIKPIQCTGKTP